MVCQWSVCPCIDYRPGYPRECNNKIRMRKNGGKIVPAATTEFLGSNGIIRCRELSRGVVLRYSDEADVLINKALEMTENSITMLGRRNDFEIDDIDGVEEYAMTSLGKLIFVDTHSRHPKSISEDDATLDSSETLSLAFENLFCMPFDIIENYGNTVRTLDLSHNTFSRNLQFLAEFENLTSLNLDHNNIDAFTIFPYMPKLQLFWLNHNGIVDLFPFVKNLYDSVPNLRYLCLMGNKAAPSYLNGGTFYDYLQYRLFVVSWFPRLIHLDDREVTREQRLEAKRLFRRPFFENFTDNAPLPECLKLIHSKITNFFAKPVLPDKMNIESPNLVI